VASGFLLRATSVFYAIERGEFRAFLFSFPDLCPKILLRIFSLVAYLPQAFAASSVGERRLSCRRQKKKNERTPIVASARTA
jgi:hypothetical protein